MTSPVENQRNNVPRSGERIPDYLLDFVQLTTQLNEIKRQGWVDRGIEDPESVSEHSFQVAILTLFMASRRRLDVAKAVKMAIIHDFPEVITGDKTPYNHLPPQEKALALQNWTPPSSEARAEKRGQEKRALLEITSKLPPTLRQEIRGLWDEYDQGLTPEAQLVQQMDQAQLIIQAGRYQRSVGGDFPIDAILQEAVASGREALKKLAERIGEGMNLNNKLAGIS